MKIERFRKIIWDYYVKYGRNFPWRRTNDPYRILVSEIMLQQTQTSRVEGKYNEFLKQFPNFRTLAKAKTRDVLRAWQGLGYNRRALNLKRTAEIVMKEYGGKLPRAVEKLEELPGIGPGTAGAIRAFAFNLPSVFIETNIRRVFIHFFFPERKKVSDEEIKALMKRVHPLRFSEGKSWREWYWALMDYGAMLGREAKENPNKKSKHYARQSKFEGSNRQLRGRILRILLSKKTSAQNLSRQTGRPLAEVKKVMASLKREGFI